MSLIRAIPLLALLAGIGCGPGGGVAWQTGSPASAGLDPGRLERAAGTLLDRGTRAFLVARGGTLALESYAPDFPAERPHYVASITKGVVGGLGLAIALGDGRVALDDPASRWIAAWRSDPVRRRITLRHLATHTSGLANDADADWARRFWSRSDHPFRIAIEETPCVATPGSDYVYSSPGYAVLSYVLTAAYRDTTTPDLQTLLRDRVFRPIGIPDEAWRLAYRHETQLDGMALHASWGGFEFSARALARIGQLLLQRGVWQGVRILDADALALASAPATEIRQELPAGTRLAPGLGWWSNVDGAWPRVPRDAFATIGAGHQLLLVVPGLELVVVRLGEALGPEATPDSWDLLEEFVMAPTVGSVLAATGSQ